MSIKNQNRLPIFALLIIGVTVISLVGLNFLVNKIAMIKAPQLAMKPAAPPPPQHQGLDDALPNPKHPKILPRVQLKNQVPPLEKNGGLKRVRNSNEQAPETERRPAERKNSSTQERPSSPPPDRNPYGYPPPLPEGLDPAERALIEQELQRRRDMMRDYPSGPPPGYYPEPDSPEDSYDPNYEDDYYDPDYEGRSEDKAKTNTKTSEYEDRDYQDYPSDEYIEEYLRKDDPEPSQKEP